jgi:acetyltransferase
MLAVSLAAGLDGSLVDATLRDGSLAHLRRAVAEDQGMLERFLNSLSEETLSSRFLESPADRRTLLRRLLPGPKNYVLLAIQNGDLVIGHAAYYRSGEETAEVGVVILDSHRGIGLGTIMVEKIARAANAAGISVFETITSRENMGVTKMVRSIGFPTSVKVESDVVRIRFPTSIDPVTIGEFRSRWSFPAL